MFVGSANIRGKIFVHETFEAESLLQGEFFFGGSVQEDGVHMVNHGRDVLGAILGHVFQSRVIVVVEVSHGLDTVFVAQLVSRLKEPPWVRRRGNLHSTSPVISPEPFPREQRSQPTCESTRITPTQVDIRGIFRRAVTAWVKGRDKVLGKVDHILE